MILSTNIFYDGDMIVEMPETGKLSLDVKNRKGRSNILIVNSMKYSVSVSTDKGGSVSGGGAYNLGDQVTVVATPDPDYRFVGWYSNGTKVSSSASYTFVVDDDIDLQARFNVDVDIVPWATGTDEQILAMVNALDGGKITIADTGWKVGDTRTVHLSAMSATGVGESHAAQDVEFVLMDTTLTGMTPANSSKPLHFAVGLKDAINGAGSIYNDYNVTPIWRDSDRRTWCNNIFANSLPPTFKECFRQFKWKLAPKYSSDSLIETTDLFAFATEKQIIGECKYSQSKEANLYTIWEWYINTSNRIKGGGYSYNGYWTSSEATETSDVCFIRDDGTSWHARSHSDQNIAPFGCI